jgi:hypothetical protein
LFEKHTVHQYHRKGENSMEPAARKPGSDILMMEAKAGDGTVIVLETVLGP